MFIVYLIYAFDFFGLGVVVGILLSDIECPSLPKLNSVSSKPTPTK